MLSRGVWVYAGAFRACSTICREVGVKSLKIPFSKGRNREVLPLGYTVLGVKPAMEFYDCSPALRS